MVYEGPRSPGGPKRTPIGFDIYVIYMLADENDITGCEWDNMLLWETGLIKFEITCKRRKPCNTKHIVRITMGGGGVTIVDEDRFVETEPIYEFYVRKCENRAVQKIKLFDNKDFGYYMMDGLCGIWYCELNPREVQKPSCKLYSCKIVAAQVSSILPLLVTLGEDGKISMYDFDAKILLLQNEFDNASTDLIWFNERISLSGMDLVASFEDVVIRQTYVDLKAQSTPTIHLTRAIKAHTAAVTKMTASSRNSLLVTGAADRTIFVYNFIERHERLDCVHLHPMGFMQFDAIPSSFNWKDEKLTILIDYDEEESLHIPAIPNLILWLRYTDRNTIGVSMGGYDADYIYELQPGVKEPVRFTIIKDEIHSYLDVGEILILGLINGKLRINHINPTDFTDMRNCFCFNMHDLLNGAIPSILSSCDGKSLISVGYDGNTFIYSWFGPEIRQIVRRSNASTIPLIIPSVTDIADPNYPSLEQD
uniref:Uncharacterized protein n=1 Tax=Glossina palpalis gambiensis TaxID=67801 RepID=A0A1B0C4N0_9MUSC